MDRQKTSRMDWPRGSWRWVTCLALTATLLSTFSGCGLSDWAHNGFKVGPDYRGRPPARVGDNWIDSDDDRVLPLPPACPDWWSVFQDPLLGELIETAYRQNLTLREAGLRIWEARYQRAITVGNILPQAQFIDGGYTRQQIGVISQPRLTPAPEFKRSADNWSLSGNLSWELDVWGRFRRSIEAADANLEGSIQEYDALLVCLIAEVVTAYIDIQTFEERLVYAKRNVEIQEGSLKLAQERFDAGKTDRISVRLSKSNVEATRATIPELEIGLRQATNRLCILLGIPPTDVRSFYDFSDGIPTAPPEVAIGIPADLVRRRPDVRAAERRVAAQSAAIGIALSDLYPRIAINGTVSVSAEDIGDLFEPLSQGGTIGPSFQWNVLNYGRIVNNANVQDARFQQLVVNYQNTVLEANREVEDAVVAFLKNQQRVDALQISADETEEALDLALIRFKEGEDDFTGVFILQGDLALKQDELAAAQGDIVTSLASVYKALGGGWQIRCRGNQFRSQVVDPEMIEEQSEPIPIPEPAANDQADAGELPPVHLPDELPPLLLAEDY